MPAANTSCDPVPVPVFRYLVHYAGMKVPDPAEGGGLMPETEKGRLTFIDERNAWFCTDPATAWGDDWNDAPHDCNAGLPYFDRGGDWYRVMFDPGNLELVGVQFGQAENKWGVLSVQEINEGAAPWLAEFDWRSGDLVNEVPAGVSVPEFVELLKESGGKVFFPEAVGS